MTKNTTASSARSVVHLFHRASQVAEDGFARRVGADGLTSRQVVVLQIVSASDRPSQTFVCNQSGIDRSTLADIVKRLIGRGYLARRRARDDARRYVLRLTPEGRDALTRALPTLDDVDKHLLQRLDPADRIVLVNALQVITAAA